MKQIILCLIGLILTQQGCALVPTQFHLSRKPAGSHKQKELKEHKLAKQQYKTEKTHSSLKEQIALVDFKLFDKDKHKSQKHHKKTITTPATGKVSTAFYPFGIDLVDIPWQGTTLMSFLVEHELDSAVLTTQEIFRQEAIQDSDSDAKKFAEEIAEKNKTINSILDLRPDVIVLQQGSIATVIPRAMLGYPQIANIPVVPEDAISTLDIDKQDLTEENRLFSNSSESVNDKPIEKPYTLTGFAKQSGRMLTTDTEQNIDTVTKKYSREFNENAQAVIVVYRNYQGQLFRFIMPNQYYGALSIPKKLDDEDDDAKKRANDEQIEKWNSAYEDFKNMAIERGDVIVFTTLDLLDLNSPVPVVR